VHRSEIPPPSAAPAAVSAPGAAQRRAAHVRHLQVPEQRKPVAFAMTLGKRKK
jgi:hypothetical protein